MKRVMVVDGNSAITRSIRGLLDRSSEDYEFREVNEADEALAVALDFAPHVIVLDRDPTSTGGPDIGVMLRADKRTRGTPIVYLSSMCLRKTLAPLSRLSRKDSDSNSSLQLNTFLSMTRDLATPADGLGSFMGTNWVKNRFYEVDAPAKRRAGHVYSGSAKGRAR